MRIARRSRRILLATAPVAVALVVGSFYISRARCFQLVGEVICRVETDRKLVALTFDDGPTTRGLDAVLPVLAAHDAKATFFVVGHDIEEDSAPARRIVAAGGELGNHTYSHSRMVLRWPSTYVDEIARTDALLRAVGVAHPTLLRAPYGKKLIGFPLAAERAGYRMISWDVEEDTSQTTPQGYARAITDRIRPGSIVLMHPMYANSQLVHEALPIIIGDLQARGYRLVTVSQLLAAGEAG